MFSLKLERYPGDFSMGETVNLVGDWDSVMAVWFLLVCLPKRNQEDFNKLGSYFRPWDVVELRGVFDNTKYDPSKGNQRCPK